MEIGFEFPNTLETGDCIVVTGTAGRKMFSLRLVSNFMAFDPDQLLEEEEINDADLLPVKNTVPLHITFRTSGEWEVLGSNPETSSNASGFNFNQNGFRTNNMFKCKILIKQEYFEIYLNGTCLSLSDHMIPVACIQRVIMNGDCVIDKLLFGDRSSVEYALRKIRTARKVPSDNILRNNLEADIVECRVKSDKFSSTESLVFPTQSNPKELVQETELQQKSDSIRSKRNSHKYSSVADLPSLRRAESYQIVFDINTSDDDNAADDSRPERNSLDLLNNNLTRTSSCYEIPGSLSIHKRIEFGGGSNQKISPFRNTVNNNTSKYGPRIECQNELISYGKNFPDNEVNQEAGNCPPIEGANTDREKGNLDHLIHRPTRDITYTPTKINAAHALAILRRRNRIKSQSVLRVHSQLSPNAFEFGGILNRTNLPT